MMDCETCSHVDVDLANFPCRSCILNPRMKNRHKPAEEGHQE